MSNRFFSGGKWRSEMVRWCGGCKNHVPLSEYQDSLNKRCNKCRSEE